MFPHPAGAAVTGKPALVNKGKSKVIFGWLWQPTNALPTLVNTFFSQKSLFARKFYLEILLMNPTLTRKWSLRLDIDSNIGVKISIFGPDEGTTTEGTSKNSEVLPSASLCEDDVAINSDNVLGRFITTYIVGNNERLRFIILQKQCWSRWAVLLLLYNLLDSVSMIFNVHNVISSLIILLPLLLWKTFHVLHGSVCFSVAWIVCSLFSFDKDREGSEKNTTMVTLTPL